MLSRLGLNPFAARGQSDAEYTRTLQRIDSLPEDQRRQNERYSFRIGRFIDDNPISNAVRNVTSGTLSSNLDEILLRYRQEARQSPSLFPAAETLRFGGRALAALTNNYTPTNTTDNREISDYERALLNRQRAGILANYGDTSLQQQVGSQLALEDFNRGDAEKQYGLAYGEDGARRFQNQRFQLSQRALYASTPGQETLDDVTRQQFVQALPRAERQRGQFLLQFIRGQGGQDLVLPGQSIEDVLGASGLSAKQQEAGRAAYGQQTSSTLQAQSEDIQDQIKFQKDLAESLKAGRGAAEDYTRAWQAFRAAQLLGVADDKAQAAAVEAVTLAQQQRVTQARSTIQALQDEGQAQQRRIDQGRQLANADPITRRVAELTLGLQNDEEQRIRRGELPNPAGGSFRGQTVGAGEAVGIVDEDRRTRLEQLARGAVEDAQGIRTGASDNVRDAQRLNEILQQQGVTMQRAQQILQEEQKFREKIAQAQAAGNVEAEKQVRLEQQKTGELERQKTILDENARQFEEARSTNLRSDLEQQIQQLPPSQQPVARAQLQAVQRFMEAQSAGGPDQGVPGAAQFSGRGGPRTVQPPIAATDLPDYAQGLLRGIYQGESTSYDQAPNRIGAAGRGQQIPDTHIRAARLAGASPMDLSPVTQDHENWELAKSDYRANSGGRSLDADARAAYAGDSTAAAMIAKYLNTTWTSLPGGKEPNKNTPRFFPTAFPNVDPSTATGLEANLPAIARSVRLGQEGTNQEAQVRFNEQQRVARLRTSLLAQGETGQADRLVENNPYLPADLQVSDAARRQAEVVTRQRQGEATTVAGTTQESDNLLRQAQAFQQGAAATADLARTLQIEKEVQRSGPGVVDVQRRAEQLQTLDINRGRYELAQGSTGQSNSSQIQQALNANPFASDPERSAIAARIQLQQKFDADSSGTLQNSAEGQRAVQDIQAKKTLDEQTQSMNDLRSAAQSASSAIGDALSNVVVHGEKGRDAIRSLGEQLRQIAFDTAVKKPLERGINALFGTIFGGGDGSGGNGYPGNGGGGGGGAGLLGNLLGLGAGGGGGGGPTGGGDGNYGVGPVGGLVGGLIAKVTGSAVPAMGGGNGNMAPTLTSRLFGSSVAAQGGLLPYAINRAAGQSGFFQSGGLLGNWLNGGGTGISPFGNFGISPAAAASNWSDPTGAFTASQTGGGSFIDSGSFDTGAGALGTDASNAVGSSAGGGLFSWLGNLFAKGDVFHQATDSLRAYENQVVHRPTIFRYAMGGQFGMMGEAGAEAVMPLTRGPDGSLGVRSHGGGGSPSVTMHVHTNDAHSFQRSQAQITAKMGMASQRAQARNATA